MSCTKSRKVDSLSAKSLTLSVSAETVSLSNYTSVSHLFVTLMPCAFPLQFTMCRVTTWLVLDVKWRPTRWFIRLRTAIVVQTNRRPTISRRTSGPFTWSSSSRSLTRRRIVCRTKGRTDIPVSSNSFYIVECLVWNNCRKLKKWRWSVRRIESKWTQWFNVLKVN